MEILAPVRGAYFRIKENPAVEDIILNLRADQPAELRREPDNPYDPNAIIVLVTEMVSDPDNGNTQGDNWLVGVGPPVNIGYVAKEFAVDIAPFLDQGADYTATIDHYANPQQPVIKIILDIEDQELSHFRYSISLDDIPS